MERSETHPVPFTVLNPPRRTVYRKVRSLNARLTMVLCIMMLTIGCLCVANQAIMMSVHSGPSRHDYRYDGYDAIGQGIWCGLMFIATAVVGMVAAQTKLLCPTVGFAAVSMATSILFIFPLIVVPTLTMVSFEYWSYRDPQKMAEFFLAPVYMILLGIAGSLPAIYSAVTVISALLKHKNTRNQEMISMSTPQQLTQNVQVQQGPSVEPIIHPMAATSNAVPMYIERPETYPIGPESGSQMVSVEAAVDQMTPSSAGSN